MTLKQIEHSEIRRGALCHDRNHNHLRVVEINRKERRALCQGVQTLRWYDFSELFVWSRDNA